MKLHIRLAPPGGRYDAELGRWWCRCEKVVGRGRTPDEAYENWRSVIPLKRRVQAYPQFTPRGYA